jgi:hypothetical protein
MNYILRHNAQNSNDYKFVIRENNLFRSLFANVSHTNSWLDEEISQKIGCRDNDGGCCTQIELMGQQTR